MLGIIQLMVLSLAIIIERRDNWKNVWFPMWVLSFLFFLCQYLFQLNIFSSFVNIETKRWMGVHDIGELKYWVFLILYIFQQLFCLIIRKLHDWHEHGVQWSSYEIFKRNRTLIKQQYIALRILMDAHKE